MKKMILLVILNVIHLGFSQQKMIDKSGTITFEASVPTFEEVRAVNKSVTFVFNPKTGEIASLAIMKGFRFKIALMEEHFNENYMESNRYPKAVFKGKIEKFDLKDINETERPYQIKGKLNLKGKSKEIIVNALIKRVPEGIQVISDFPISFSDFNIRIPASIAAKISKTANTALTGIVHSDEVRFAVLK